MPARRLGRMTAVPTKPVWVPILLALITSAMASAVQAHLPVEQVTTGSSTVQVYGGSARPIGAIDFSASATGSRRVGPWELRTDRLEDSGRVLFYDDGSLGAEGNLRRERWVPPAGRTCTTHDNVTVCR